MSDQALDSARRALRRDRSLYPFAKRALDVGSAGAGGLLLLPVALGIAAAIRWSSPGPILFRQVRAGRGGRPFGLYKFRTMRVGARSDAAGKVHVDAPIAADDPAITPLGRWLRRYGLDEIPQILNVLRGDMSLVGPRPTIPEQVAAYTAWERRRLEVLPGITGLAQVSGRNNLPWPERIRLDIDYVDSRSFREDLRLLGLTFRRVFLERTLHDE